MHTPVQPSPTVLPRHPQTGREPVTDAHQREAAVVIRAATEADAAELQMLAELASSRAPSGPALIGELGGRPVAAVLLEEGRAISDPFVATSQVVALLQLRALQLKPTNSTLRARLSPRRWFPRRMHLTGHAGRSTALNWPATGTGEWEQPRLIRPAGRRRPGAPPELRPAGDPAGDSGELRGRLGVLRARSPPPRWTDLIEAKAGGEAPRLTRERGPSSLGTRLDDFDHH